MESLFSFPVGLFHPLQHASLSRRTPVCRPHARTIRMLRLPNERIDFFTRRASSPCDAGRRSGRRSAARYPPWAPAWLPARRGACLAGWCCSVVPIPVAENDLYQALVRCLCHSFVGCPLNPGSFAETLETAPGWIYLFWSLLGLGAVLVFHAAASALALTIWSGLICFSACSRCNGANLSP